MLRRQISPLNENGRNGSQYLIAIIGAHFHKIYSHALFYLGIIHADFCPFHDNVKLNGRLAGTIQIFLGEN